MLMQNHASTSLIASTQKWIQWIWDFDRKSVMLLVEQQFSALLPLILMRIYCA